VAVDESGETGVGGEIDPRGPRRDRQVAADGDDPVPFDQDGGPGDRALREAAAAATGAAAAGTISPGKIARINGIRRRRGRDIGTLRPPRGRPAEAASFYRIDGAADPSKERGVSATASRRVS